MEIEMKKILTNAVGILAILFTSAGLAEEEDGIGGYLTAGYNWFEMANKSSVDDDDAVFGAIGIQTTRHWAYELKFSEFEASYLNLSSVYRLQPRSENSIFFKGGIGRYSGIPDDGINFNLGAGFEYYTNDNLSLVFGVDSIYQKEIKAFDWVPYVGLSYFFGGDNRSAQVKPKAQKPALLDSDNDSVIDSLDQCPDSVAGAVVNAHGCELDGDNDGVVDRLDSCLETPAGAKVDDKGCRIILTENVSIDLHVQFATNSDVVTDEYRSDIKRVADFMSEYPDTNVVIEGHTDSMGKASYNKALSKKRATAVMQYLVSTFGVDPARVSADGKGEESPVADNASKEGRAANRRVQAEIKTSVSKPQ